jgi:NADP-dependent 3-hydroxy acid dehydrogenase YdfG
MSQPSSSSSPSLSGKTAIVTGASSGIGLAIATTLGRAGAHVFLVGRTGAPMETAAKEIEQAGGRATVKKADVRDVAQMRGLVDAAVKETGRLDVLVNNAGLSYPASILDGEPEQWREMLETNVLALLVGAQAAVRAMRACKAQGFVVNISSIAAQRPDSGVYGSTKHAVNCISATLRRELEEDSIRVVNVMPGAIATNFARNFDPKFVAGFAKAVGMDDVVIEPGKHVPDELLRRLQTAARKTLSAPEDVANAVLFAVTQPIEVNVAEIVVRPQKQLNL